MVRTLFLIGFFLPACGTGEVKLEGDTPSEAPPINGGDDSGEPTDSGGVEDSGSADSGDSGAPPDSGDTGDSGDSGALEDIAVDLVLPSTGLTTGGEEVVVYGGPFDESAVVRFGEAEAITVSWTSTTVTVTTPPASVAGSVDVEVTTQTGHGSSVAAFTYEEPCTGLTASPDYVHVDNDADEDVTITFTGCATGIAAEDDVVYDASYGLYGAEWIEVPATSVDGTLTLVLRYYAEPRISFAASFYPYLETDQGRVMVEVDPR